MERTKGAKNQGSRPGDWIHAGKCRDNPQLFDPIEHGGTQEERTRIAQAQAICAGCPSATDCLAWGLEHQEKGVWGGEYRNDGHDRGTKRKAA